MEHLEPLFRASLCLVGIVAFVGCEMVCLGVCLVGHLLREKRRSFPATVVLPIYRRAAALWFGPSSLVFNDPDLRDFE
ncbi:hypothetical protein MRX96_035964 [Rhipicephalus microplus]